MTKTKTKTMTKTNTFREHIQRATLETCGLWNIWSEWWGGHDLTNKSTMTKTKTNTRTKTNTNTKTKTKTKTKTISEACEIWDTNYNSENREHKFMTIFVAWQLKVTLDSICNSCDVFVRRSTKKQMGIHVSKKEEPYRLLIGRLLHCVVELPH